MVFSSITFTFIYLPIVLFLYFLSKEEYRNIILFIASIVFYAVGEPKAVILMLASIALNYMAGVALGIIKSDTRRKIILILDVAVNIGILYWFKYLGYTIKLLGFVLGRQFEALDIALPIGISFFTFQAMSYVIDVYRGDVAAERNILNVGLYISFFPQLIAGPIVRYNSISQQIKNRVVTADKFSEGILRFVKGFAKKIILANNLSLLAEEAFGCTDIYKLPVLLAWAGSIAFSLQIYFDFSGYSDMAIGLGKMFGFEFEENFNYPYIANSITDFWRRWHISLSRWFRDYVYIPLGGSRKGIFRQIINLFVVWLLTGLWHGANITFVAWGLMYFVLLALEKTLIKPETKNAIVKLVYRMFVLLVINTGWILFKTESFHVACRYIKVMLGLYGNDAVNAYTLGLFREHGILFVFGILFSTPLMARIGEQVKKNDIVYRYCSNLMPLMYMVMFLVSLSFLILGAHNPFIYFNF